MLGQDLPFYHIPVSSIIPHDACLAVLAPPSNNCHLCDSANDASRYISTGDEDEISEEDEEDEEEFDEEDEVEDAEEDVDKPDAKAADGKSINLYDGVARLEAFNRHPCITSQ